MLKRIERENLEKINLQPYACFACEAKRNYPEKRDEYRTDFQRDCQRIYHCQAFRRMQGKRQVLPVMTNDHIRTRLTHTLEVTQIARSLARTQGLNEDLAEAIALGHDLGHTPFGHVGQTALNDFMQKHGGHFEHNEQSLRVVKVLEEKTPDYQGLNLTTEVLNGLDKHRTAHKNQASLEGQVVNLADEIAYNGHDLEDALQNKIIDLEQIKSLKIWVKIGEDLGEKCLPVLVASRVIHFFVEDLNLEIERKIAEIKPKTSAEIQNMSEGLADFSVGGRVVFEELKKFLWDNYYGKEGLADAEIVHEKVVRFCDFLLENPAEIKQYGKDVIGVMDYVAGMTDEYFEREYQKLIEKK